MSNRITKLLNIKYPIIQAPMNWLTDAKQVAAVGEAGGLGFLGPNAGQWENATSMTEIIHRMRNEIGKVKRLTDKPFGVPLIVSYDLSAIDDMAQMLIEEKVPVVLINDLLDEKAFAILKQAGIKIIYRPITPTIENAKQAQSLGADIFVTTGFDEGGSVPTQVIGSFSVVSHIVDALDIPVMLAGGIADVRGVRAAFALGAEGVYVGTLFLATEESRAADKIKQMIVQSNANDLHLFRTNPAYYRSLPTTLSHQLIVLDEQGASRETLERAMKGGYGMRLGMLEGNTEEGYISVGNGISLINTIRPVKQVIDDLMQDFIVN